MERADRSLQNKEAQCTSKGMFSIPILYLDLDLDPATHPFHEGSKAPVDLGVLQGLLAQDDLMVWEDVRMQGIW